MRPTSPSIAMHGAAGRMGVRILQMLRDDPEARIGAALERPDHPGIGRDVGPLLGGPDLGIPIAASLDGPVDVVIDFSSPAASLAIAEACRVRKVPLVVGTTGFEPGQKARLEAAGGTIPLLISANFSRAVYLLMHLSGIAGKALGADADIEIVERHHRFKRDAPSGTALRLAQVIGEATGHPDDFLYGRHGDTGDRPRGQIGVHALRTGDNPGEHTVVFGLMGESLELSHRALNRDGFARGAIDAAKFLAGRPAGLYMMKDLLGILMARCEQGYLCEVCGRDVEGLSDSDLYLRYVLGEVDPETLHLEAERHIRCNPTLAQFIVAEGFEPVVVDGPFAKAGLDPDWVADEERRVTAGYLRLEEIARSGDGLPIAEYPPDEVRARWSSPDGG